MKMEASELKVTKLLQLYDTMLQNTSKSYIVMLRLYWIHDFTFVADIEDVSKISQYQKYLKFLPWILYQHQ